MKKKSSYPLILTTVLSVAATSLWAVPVTYVDDDYHPGTPGWGVTRFATIADGMNAADPGGTVEIAEGLYAENVVVTKRLTLRGPNAGVAGCAGRSVEALIYGGTGVALDIQSHGVTINGLAMAGAVGLRNQSRLNVAIRNNFIWSDAVGIQLQGLQTTPASNVSVIGNCVIMSTQITGGTPTVGLMLTDIHGARAPVVASNTVSAAFYGYLLYDVHANEPLRITDGAITYAMQGVTVRNVDLLTGTIHKPSFFAVERMMMSDFTGDHPALTNENFHAGVHVFSSGSNPAAVVSGTVQRVTIRDTGSIAPNSAGCVFSDVSTGNGFRQIINLEQCLLENNANRGLLVQGQAQARVSRSLFNANGGAPYGLGGNDGFGLSAINGAVVTMTECVVTNPPAVAGGYNVSALALFTVNGAAPTVTVTHCAFENNNNAAGRLATVSAGALYAPSNWWGHISGPTHSTNPYGSGGLVLGNCAYVPWLASGTDSSPAAGFQPNLTVAFPPRRVVFSVQPQGAMPGRRLGRPPVLRVEDDRGVFTPWAEPLVTLSLITNVGGAFLTGSNAVTAIGGVATFSDLGLEGGITGASYAVAAEAPYLAGATSTAFHVWQTVGGFISTSSLWGNDVTYAMTSHVFVLPGSTLTLAEGVVVRGAPQCALVIPRGARLEVLGTASNPVVLTDFEDDHMLGLNPSPGSGVYANRTNGVAGTWGGLMVLGRGWISGGGERLLPGLEAYGPLAAYGGTNDADDSGVLRWLSVRYAGGPIGGRPGRGITLAGVGRGTTMDHVEVFHTLGDGIGFLGGAVDASELIVWGCGDDAFECSEGYRGRGQFWLGVQTPLAAASNQAGHSLEFNGGYSNGLPTAVPTLSQLTLIGLGANSGVSNNSALHFRDTAGGRVRNSLLLDFGGAAALVHGATGGVPDSADAVYFDYASLSAMAPALYPPRGGGKVLEVRSDWFWGMSRRDTGLQSPTNAVPWGGDAGPYFACPLFRESAWENRGLRAAPGAGEVDPLPIRRLQRTSVAASNGWVHPVLFLNPLPNTDFYGQDILTRGRLPPVDDFFRSVWFMGAFDPQRNWAAPWSTAFRHGLLTNGTPGEVEGTIVDIRAQGLDEGVVITSSNPLTVTVHVTAGAGTGLGADWWCLAHDETRNLWWCYEVRPSGNTWKRWTGGVTYQGALTNVPTYAVVNSQLLPAGSYRFYFGVDPIRNSLMDEGRLRWDSVDVTIVP